MFNCPQMEPIQLLPMINLFIYLGLQISASACLPWVRGPIFQEKKMPTKHNEMPFIRRTIALNDVYNASIVLFLSRSAFWLL